MRTNLSDVNASFFGEDDGDSSGVSVSFAGDVNGDGFDDLVVGAYLDDYGGGDDVGQIYLVFGGSDGWSMHTNLSSVNASFNGEDNDDYSGISVSSAGDVNGDGFDDLIIGAYGDEYASAANAGQTYLIYGDNSGFIAKTINTVYVGNESDFSEPADVNVTVVGVNSPLYINVTATGGSAGIRDIIQLWVNSTDAPYPIKVKAYETGDDTGEYHGKYYVRTAASNKLNRRVRVLNGSQTFIQPIDNSSTTNNIRVFYGSGPAGPVDPCTPTSGVDWEIDASMNCSIVGEDYTVGNISFINSGSFRIEDTNITGENVVMPSGVKIIRKPPFTWRVRP
jgi:hypothetical protein